MKAPCVLLARQRNQPLRPSNYLLFNRRAELAKADLAKANLAKEDN
jgi:hypothetical protein